MTCRKSLSVTEPSQNATPRTHDRRPRLAAHVRNDVEHGRSDSPRAAQEAMRHSSIELTMNLYTDPMLLDVQGAVESLPEISVTYEPAENQQRIAAGAENLVAVTVAVDGDSSGVLPSTPVIYAANSSESPEMRKRRETMSFSAFQQ